MYLGFTVISHKLDLLLLSSLQWKKCFNNVSICFMYKQLVFFFRIKRLTFEPSIWDQKKYFLRIDNAKHESCWTGLLNKMAAMHTLCYIIVWLFNDLAEVSLLESRRRSNLCNITDTTLWPLICSILYFTNWSKTVILTGYTL